MKRNFDESNGCPFTGRRRVIWSENLLTMETKQGLWKEFSLYAGSKSFRLLPTSDPKFKVGLGEKKKKKKVKPIFMLSLHEIKHNVSKYSGDRLPSYISSLKVLRKIGNAFALDKFDIHMSVHRKYISKLQPKKMQRFLIYLFLQMLYMFHALPPPIIRSTELYIQLQVLSTNTAACCYCGWDGTPPTRCNVS